MTTDIRLLKLWEQWKDALAYELEATSQEIADKRRAVTDEIEWLIEAERAEGPIGLVIQMGLARIPVPNSSARTHFTPRSKSFPLRKPTLG
jgi:hypothetical protein